MKTKTLILAIFGLLALANAGGRRQKTLYKEAPPRRPQKPFYLSPAKAYADPGYEQPAYAYPGYQQPTAKRLAKRDAAAYADPDVIKRYAPIGPLLAAYADPDVITRYARDLIEEEGVDPMANIKQHKKAYANPGYEQPAYKYVQFKLNYSGISCSYT